MGYRAVFIYSVTFLVWSFLCFIELETYGFNVLPASFGAAVGLICGVVAPQQQLKIIEKNGEFKATRKRWAFALLAIIVVVTLLLYLVLSFGLTARQMISFVFLILPLFYATQIVLFLNWERKQKKHILFEGFTSTRVYASPETEKR